MSAFGNGRLGHAEYGEMLGRIQEAVAANVPVGSSLLVISKGDAAMLDLPGLTALHFPQDGSGGYAGHHPSDSAAATAELEERRRAGAEFLVIPATARWWLQYYKDFASHLAGHGELVVDLPDTCLIYGLGLRGVTAPGAPTIERPQASIEQVRDYLERLLTTDRRLVVLEAVDGVAAGLAPLDVARLRADGATEENEFRVLSELRLLADDGADYLIVPRSSDDWLDCCPEFSGEVESNCHKVAEQRHLCRVFDLHGLKEDV
jgi:hypothetical protein